MAKPLPLAHQFRKVRLDQIQCNAIYGVCYAGSRFEAHVAVIGPDRATAYEACGHIFGSHFDESRGQNVVILPAEKFADLLQRSGIDIDQMEQA